MIIAGTGHRPAKTGGYSNAAHERLVRLARSALQELRPTLIISGGALGWDTALAAAAHLEAIPYTVAVPFKGQESTWPRESQLRYLKMLELATHIEYVCAPGYASWKMQRRNEWMVDGCDLVLALWNGTSGGTYNCIAYAERVGKPIQNLWAKFKELP